jgi:hypothetical protein
MIFGNTDSTITEYSLFNRQHFFIKPTPRTPHQINADSVSLLQKSTDLYSRINGTLRSLQVKSVIQFHGKEVQYETLST